MAAVLNTTDYLNTVTELLRQGHGPVSIPIRGTSMTPFLHEGDTVLLDLPEHPLHPGDIALYTRPNGSYVLHRILRVSGNTYTMAGDSQTEKEAGVPREAVHAVVTGGSAGGKPVVGGFRAQFYRTVWQWCFPIRSSLITLGSKAHKKGQKK